MRPISAALSALLQALVELIMEAFNNWLDKKEARKEPDRE